MADWITKLEKVAAHDLRPGERLRCAVFLQPTGTTSRLVTRAVSGSIAVTAAAGAASTALGTEAGRAASMPDDAAIVGVTDRRLLVYGHSAITGRAKGLRLEMPLDELVAVAIEKQKAIYDVVLHFSDGSASVYEAPRYANDPERFAAHLAAR